MSQYSVYLRSHDGGMQLASRTRSGSRDAALTAFRHLLGRRDLDGQPVAAVLRDQLASRTLLFSRFDLPDQQLVPSDPIDLDRLSSEVADVATCAIVAARAPAAATDDPADLVARAKADPAMIRDFGTTPGQAALTDAELGTALGYSAPSGRATVSRIAEGKGTETARLLLMALLDGWRPRRGAA